MSETRDGAVCLLHAFRSGASTGGSSFRKEVVQLLFLPAFHSSAYFVRHAFSVSLPVKKRTVRSKGMWDLESGKPSEGDPVGERVDPSDKQEKEMMWAKESRIGFQSLTELPLMSFTFASTRLYSYRQQRALRLLSLYFLPSLQLIIFVPSFLFACQSFVVRLLCFSSNRGKMREENDVVFFSFPHAV